MKRRLGQRKARVALVCILAVVAFTMLTGVALADTSSATLSGPVPAMTAPDAGTFTGTLSGAAKSIEGADWEGFVVTDASGTGAGWYVTVAATQFTDAADAGSLDPVRAAHALHTIYAGSLTAGAYTMASKSGDSSADPGLVQTASAIDAAGGAGVVMIDTTTFGQGMGTYTYTTVPTEWKLALTANQYAGTYTSTITTTLTKDALSFTP